MPRSVIGLTGDEIRRSADIGDKVVDVVFGGPPCQGFSLIGHRLVDDPRNRLVSEFIRIVVELGAAYFVFENVKGLTVGKQRDFLSMVIDEFTDHGYNIRLPWKVLNSKHYDVPQERERLFLLGAKRGLSLPEYPRPVSGSIADLFDSGNLGPVPTCQDALDDLPNPDHYPELLAGDSVRVKDWGAASTYAGLMRCENDEGWHHGYRRKWDSMALTASMRTAHTDISRRRFARTPQGEIEPISRFFRLPAHGQSNTLRAGTDSARGAFTSPRPIHYALPRCVSVREMARLHGCPDWFRFHMTKWHGARQIGNSVPPPLARCIATSIMESIGGSPTKPKAMLELGDVSLLAMDMSEASVYWGVDVPIRRRDRKSGARKRKQYEIEAERIAALG